MQAATPLALSVKLDKDRVFIDGESVDCTEYEIAIPTGGGPVTVLLRKSPEPGGTFRAVLCAPNHPPLVFALTSGAVTMLSRQCARTVVDWMCKAASIEL